MYLFWYHIIAVLTLLVVSANLQTVAYFADAEGNRANVLASTKLDGTLSGEPFADATCKVGEKISSLLQFENTGEIDFLYDATVENLSGVVCENFRLQVSKNNTEVYEGDIENFLIEAEALAVGAFDTWEYELRYIGGEVTVDVTCQFDTVFDAYQSEYQANQAFHDSERTTHSVVVQNTSQTSITVVNNNTATVTNNVVVSTNTGGNTASGGGSVETGVATATATVINTVNTNIVEIESGCNCDCGSDCGDTNVTNDNSSVINNSITSDDTQASGREVQIITTDEYFRERGTTTLPRRR